MDVVPSACGKQTPVKSADMDVTLSPLQVVPKEVIAKIGTAEEY